MLGHEHEITSGELSLRSDWRLDKVCIKDLQSLMTKNRIKLQFCRKIWGGGGGNDPAWVNLLQ